MWISDFSQDCRRLYSARQGNKLVKFIALLFVPSVHIMFTYRVGHSIVKLWPPFSWLLLIPYAIVSFIVRVLYQTRIPARATIGPGCVILHHGGIVIHPAAVLGRNVTIGNQVVVGVSKLGDPRCPTIADEVFLATGCKVLGPLTVNHHSMIGANAVVLKDVPAYATMGGVPAKVLKVDRPRRDRGRRGRRPRRRSRNDRDSNVRVYSDKREGVIHVQRSSQPVAEGE
jgi:serine O-acetyltransferase